MSTQIDAILGNCPLTGFNWIEKHEIDKVLYERVKGKKPGEREKYLDKAVTRLLKRTAEAIF